MSVKATDRAWESSASGNDLLVLLALADHAGAQDDPYDYAYPSVARLEGMTRLSRRTVQRCLRSLEEAGAIRRTGEYTWGRGKVTTQYRIEATLGVNVTGRQPDAASPEVPGGASPVTPNPPIDPSSSKQDAGERAQASPDAFPDDLPPELHDVAVQAGKILKRTAQVRGQRREVTRAAVGHAVLTFPDRDHVRVARDVEAWLLHGKGASRVCADVVARFRNFLDSSEPMAGPPLPAGVTPLHGRRESASDMLRALRGDVVDGSVSE